MAISNELINKYAKLNKEKQIVRETTVFGVTVKQGDKIYVKMDGSDLLTPVSTTSEVEAGEKVTVMVKDHTAIITGNITSPSASKKTTDAITEEMTTISAAIGNFELVVADKVSTKELEAEIARVEKLIAGEAYIEDLTAIKANIERLFADYAEIDHALIGKADIVDLEAANANIDILNTNVANIQTLIGGNLTMNNIQSLVLTSSKVTVDNAFIKDAMIDRVSASKITAGQINTSLVNLSSEDGSMTIVGSLQQFKDSNGNVRIQLGKDATGDFTFVLYGADGNGQLINQNGITASAISDGIIVNDMIANDACISGDKLDISSVINEINDSGSTISSSKIYFDGKEQTLDVAFNTLSTKVDLIEGVDGDLGPALEQIAANSTNIEVAQGAISTLITNTTITKENGEVIQLKDDYSSFKQDMDGIETIVSSLETNMDEVDTKVSSFEQTLDGFNSRVSDTEIKLHTLEVGAENYLDRTTDTPTPAEWTSEYDILIASPVLLSTHKLEPGDVLTYRIYIDSSNVDLSPALYFSNNDGVEVVYGDKLTTENIPGYIYVTAPIPENTIEVSCYIHKDDTETLATIQYSRAKLERGTIPTEWTLSVEDTRTLVDESMKMTLADGSVAYISDKMSETMATVNNITNTVSYIETYFDENGTVTNLTEQMSRLEQLSSQFTMEFFEKIETVDQGMSQLFGYIKFDVNGITIGQEDYPIRLKLTKDKIQFIDEAETELAYLTEGKLYVNRTEILDTLSIGNYGFMSSANGGMTIGAIR